jgi:hypothetical protein
METPFDVFTHRFQLPFCLTHFVETDARDGRLSGNAPAQKFPQNGVGIELRHARLQRLGDDLGGAFALDAGYFLNPFCQRLNHSFRLIEATTPRKRSGGARKREREFLAPARDYNRDTEKPPSIMMTWPVE